MKKIYIQPNFKLLDLSTEDMIAGSQLDPTASGDQTVTPDPTQPSPDEFTSKGGNAFSLWED